MRRRVDQVADVAAGTSRHSTMQPAPGAYVAFCNIVDDMGMGSSGMGQTGGGVQHVHFELGMHTSFTVGS